MKRQVVTQLIDNILSTDTLRFQEYRLTSDNEPELNPKTGKPNKKDSLKPDGAILFEYLCYNSFKLAIEDQASEGFFYHSYKRIEAEYGIGKERVQKITAYLEALGIVETKVCGYPQNTHYRIRFDQLAKVEVLTKLYNVTPARVGEIANQYANVVQEINQPQQTAQIDNSSAMRPDDGEYYVQPITHSVSLVQKHTSAIGRLTHEMLSVHSKSVTAYKLSKERGRMLPLSDLGITPAHRQQMAVALDSIKSKNTVRYIANAFGMYCNEIFRLYGGDASANQVLKRLPDQDIVEYFFQPGEVDNFSTIVTFHGLYAQGLDNTPPLPAQPNEA